MGYKCCKYLAEGIEFRYNGVALCNRVGHKGGGDIVAEFYNEEKDDNFCFNVEKYLKKRRQVILQNQTDNLYPNCEGCMELHNQTFNYFEDLKLSNIILHHWTKCNSNCIYCYSSKNKEYYNKRRHYKVLPLIKNLERNKLLNYGGFVNWAGGEISCLEEFNDVEKIFDRYDWFSLFNSSGIKYEETIAMHLKNNRGLLIISTDSGTKETHEKIKRVRSFDKVWQNIERYSAAAENKSLLQLKYIIIHGINDNKGEISAFLNKVKSLGLLYVIFDIDLYYLNDNRDNIPEYIAELFDYAREEAEKAGLRFFIYTNSSVLLTQGKYADTKWNKYIYGDDENVKAFDRVYAFNKDGSYRKYPSIKFISASSKIPYNLIRKSCLEFKKGNIFKVKNTVYAYENDINPNNTAEILSLKTPLKTSLRQLYTKFCINVLNIWE